jgi:hypothetical protein
MTRVRPKIKFDLFPLPYISNKFAATQKNFFRFLGEESIFFLTLILMGW